VARVCAWLSYLVPKRIVTNSARARVVHRDFGYAERFVVIPNGLDLHSWKPKPDERALVHQALGLPPDAYLVGHVGRADPQKDHNNLIAAFSLLAGNDARVHLLLAGAGLSPGDEYLRKLLIGRDLGGRVLGLGPRDDVPKLMQAMDLFVLSSAGEAFPNVVVEAMSCGIPCVVTDVGDAAEIVGDTGWVVPSRDPAALAAALRQAFHETPQQRAARSVQARRRVEENYGIERMVLAYHRVWDEVSRRRAEPCAA
jgi:glycosyltransferase involved in cell wall biosynthesis